METNYPHRNVDILEDLFRLLTFGAIFVRFCLKESLLSKVIPRYLGYLFWVSKQLSRRTWKLTDVVTVVNFFRDCVGHGNCQQSNRCPVKHFVGDQPRKHICHSPGWLIYIIFSIRPDSKITFLIKSNLMYNLYKFC